MNKDASVADQRCIACWSSPESMLHLAECDTIYENYWKHLLQVMREVDIATNGHPAFLLFGRTASNRTTCKEGADFLAIGWRCLYAEITRARIDQTRLQLKKAVKRALGMIISRVTAYGEKWRLWYVKQRYHKNAKFIPLKHRKYKLQPFYLILKQLLLFAY